MKHYLTVDLGTGNTRVCLTDSEGKFLCTRQFSNEYQKDELYPDALFFLPKGWKEKIINCFDEIAAEYPDVKVSAISCAAARQTMILIDRDKNAFYSLPNIDNRGREFMHLIDEHEKIYNISGKWVTEDFCAAKLMGLRMKRPDVYARIYKAVSLSGWIAHIFTGKCITEPSQGCEFGLYDLDGKCWSQFICDKYGIDIDILPDLVNAGEIVGDVFDEYKKRFHLADDCVFINGGADTQMAVKTTDCSDGDIIIVSGTTSPVVTKTKKHICDKKQRLWVDADLGAEDFLLEMNPGCTGLNYQKIKEFLCPDISYDELEASYQKKTDFKSVASFTSLLFYEQRSLRHGGFFMKSPLEANFDRYDMAYAVLADSACAIYEQLFRLIEISGNDPEYLYGCGGGFRSETLCQMIADLSGKELRLRPGFEQATVLGAVHVMNDVFGEKMSTSGSYKSIRPKDGKLIKAYYKEWLPARTKANKI